MWYVGDTFKGIAPPAPKHFEKVTWKKDNSPIDLLREKLDGHDIVWDKAWGLERLNDELRAVENFLRRKAEADKRREEEIKNREG
jgi:hypothetical protein